jgi:N6-adenosine-specific RNA methylase IME4
LRKVTPNQTRELDYATMSIDDIFVLLDRDIFSLASVNHTIFMWAIDQFLHETEHNMKQRGYRLHARIIWDKGNGVAPAFTIRYTHEYLLWFYKAKMTPVTREMRGKLGTVITGKQREHSRKPEEAYTYVSALFPNAKKMDVFSREPREDWLQWGNECNKFATREASCSTALATL